LKPHILHIVDSFEQGGTERQALQLVRLLHESGRYRVHLACLQKQGLLRAEAEALGLGEIREYALNNFYDRNFLVQIRRLTRFLKETEIRIVHSHDFYTNIFGMTAAAISHVHVRIASKRETDGFRSSMQKRVERGAYSLAHAVVVNSDAVGRHLMADSVPAEKIVTIYNGLTSCRVTLQPGIERKEMLSRLGLPTQPERRFVTIVGNLQHEVKDHRTFLRVAARVRDTCPQAAFVLAGEGKLMDSLREFAVQLGLERDVFFLGRCERIAELLGISEVCVLSSKAEGFSNAILEYMAAARPVVATDVGGAREAIIDGETGYIVSPGDEDAMAMRIVKLLHDPKRAEAMGKRGQVAVGERFSCEAQRDRTLALYDRLLDQPLQTPQPAVAGLRRESA